MSQKSNWLGAITFGTLFITVYLFFLFQADVFFPTEEWRFKILLMIILTFIPFVWDTARSFRQEARILRTEAIKEIPRIALVTIAGLVFFIVLFMITKPLATGTVQQALVIIPRGALLVLVFMFALSEEFFFRLWLPERLEESGMGKALRTLISAITFAGFHWGVSGGNYAVLITYVPLGLFFSYVRDNGFPGLVQISPRFFGPSPITQTTNAAVHYAWNLFVLGFLGG